MVKLEEGIKYLINQDKIFLTGKSGVGKSYLSKQLPHKVLELDSVILKLMKKYKMNRQDIFTQVYKNKGSEKLMNDFKRRVLSFIKKNQKSKIIIEGAISDISLIKELFNKDFIIVFLYPSSEKRYYNRLLERYNKNPKSLPFVINDKDKLNEELKKITKDMIKGSKERYNMFKKELDIYKVNV